MLVCNSFHSCIKLYNAQRNCLCKSYVSRSSDMFVEKNDKEICFKRLVGSFMSLNSFLPGFYIFVDDYEETQRLWQYFTVFNFDRRKVMDSEIFLRDPGWYVCQNLHIETAWNLLGWPWNTHSMCKCLEQGKIQVLRSALFLWHEYTARSKKFRFRLLGMMQRKLLQYADVGSFLLLGMGKFRCKHQSLFLVADHLMTVSKSVLVPGMGNLPVLRVYPWEQERTVTRAEACPFSKRKTDLCQTGIQVYPCPNSGFWSWQRSKFTNFLASTSPKSITWHK